MSKRVPLTAWNTDGLGSRLVVGGLVASIDPTADREGWIWEIRGQRARATTAPIARNFTRLPSMRAAQVAAEDALREIARQLLEVLGPAHAEEAA